MDRATLTSWVRGQRLPRARRQQLEHLRAVLAGHEALATSGLPECAEAATLNERAMRAVLSRPDKAEIMGNLSVIKEHEGSCELCRRRRAIRDDAAGPTNEFPKTDSKSNLLFLGTGMLGLTGWLLGTTLGFGGVTWGIIGAIAGAGIGILAILDQDNLWGL
ncbi:MAG: hypothetical protein RQ745_13965 [Longimicrobiales bacterium]|nr:hypothetical protein [Longimicrobiales bacterium]